MQGKGISPPLSSTTQLQRQVFGRVRLRLGFGRPAVPPLTVGAGPLTGLLTLLGGRDSRSPHSPGSAGKDCRGRGLLSWNPLQPATFLASRRPPEAPRRMARMPRNQYRGTPKTPSPGPSISGRGAGCEESRYPQGGPLHDSVTRGILFAFRHSLRARPPGYQPRPGRSTPRATPESRSGRGAGDEPVLRAHLGVPPTRVARGRPRKLQVPDGVRRRPGRP